MGRYECDSPAILIETMLKRFNEEYGKQDVIFLTGDLTAHSTAAPIDDPTWKDTYALLLSCFTGINELLVHYFPDTLILPAFGNNDSKYHDNPIPDSDRDFFYDYVYRLWFELLPANAKHLLKLPEETKEAIRSDFMTGGYYRIDLQDDLSVLSLNSLYYDSERDPDIAHGSGSLMMEWLST